MGRGREYRGGGKSRRPYEENAAASAVANDLHESSPAARDSLPTEGTAVGAVVKWFNPEKGFGFAEIADGFGDAFLHIKAVHAFGQEAVLVGTKLSVVVGKGQKGRQITKVLSIGG